MAARHVYEASHIKRRRATKHEMAARKAALWQLAENHQPATVRQIFYLATVRGLVEKTEAGYAKVQRILADLRRGGDLPWHWIADNTRWMRRPRCYDSMEDALHQTAAFYRRDLLRDADAYVEIWLEKDALSGVFFPITSDYTVPLMVSRGFASLSFLHEAAEVMGEEDRTCFVYHFGDYDPSGQLAADKIEETLLDLAPWADIRFQRMAVTPDQIKRFNLPTRPTKRSKHSRGWKGGDSVELDAIPPNMLRELVRICIERHLPADKLKVVRAAEESERALLLTWAQRAES